MLKPATLYDYEDEAQTTLVNDALLVFIGGFFVMTYTPFAIGEWLSMVLRKRFMGDLSSITDANHGYLLTCPRCSLLHPGHAVFYCGI